MAAAVLSLSVLLQCAAAWLAFRLRRETSSRSWYLVCIAVGLMAIRRSITLVRVLTGASQRHLDPWAESVALLISILMVVGLALIRPLFRSMAEATSRIRRSEEHFRHLIENAEDIVTVVDSDGTILYESPAAHRLLGYGEDRRGVRIFETMHPEDHEAARCQLGEAFAAPGELRELVLRARAADGTWHTLECTGRVQPDPDGSLVAIVNSRDVTARLKLEAAAARMGRILNRSLNEIYLFDPTTLRFDLANDGALQNLGYSLAELQRLTPMDLKPEYSAETFEARIAPLRAGALRTTTIRTRHRRKDGSQYPVEVHLQLLRGDGAPVFVAVTLDLSEQERADAERHKLELQLRRAQRLESIGTLAGGIAHDFNNILTPILGYLDMAMPRVVDDEATTRHLQRANTAAERARDLVQRILTFSREMEQDRVPVGLDQVIAETLALLRSSLPSTIDIRFDAPSDVCWTVLADPTQMHQVVLNLCTNAAHAMREQGGTLEVDLATFEGRPPLSPHETVAPVGAFVRMRVRDTGSGMDARTSERIFEPFFTTKATTEGSGLGLSVVHGIVKSYGGSIAVQTEPGVGTTVDVYLPLVTEEVAAEVRPPTVIPRGRGRVLFVDDEEPIAELGRELLESLGYEVTVLFDGCSALATMREDPAAFDVVVTDETMPGMRGTDLGAALLELRADLPILLTTGFSEGITLASVRRLGFRDLVHKPYGKRELAEALDAVLSA